MIYNRIIGRLDIKGPNLVKGIHLEGLRVLGKPDVFAKLYVEEGIDELFYQDVVASLYERNSLLDLIKKTANSISIPLTVGGGIRSLNDIDQILKSGADKIAINTAAIKNPEIIYQAAKVYGSSTIVVTLEVSKLINNKHCVYTDNGREFWDINAIDWAKRVENLGAGEILLTSIDNEGTGKGFDINITQIISESVNIPVIAHGGAKTSLDIIKVLTHTQARAVAISSMLHYGYLDKVKLNSSNYEEGNTDFIKKNINYKDYAKTSIIDIKKALLPKILTRI